MEPGRLHDSRLRRHRRHRRRARRRLIAAIVLGGALAALALGAAHVARLRPGGTRTVLPASPAMPGVTAALMPDDSAASIVPPRYPYSIVPGGVHSVAQMRAAIRADRVVATHYADFDLDAAHVEALPSTLHRYVSFRIGDSIYWTRGKLTIPRGELVITDGEHIARTRCGNQLSAVPRQPVLPADPPLDRADRLSSIPLTLFGEPFVGSPAFSGPLAGRPLDAALWAAAGMAAPGGFPTGTWPAVPFAPGGVILIPGGPEGGPALTPGTVITPGEGEIDDVLPTPTPEPATLLMLGTGLAGLLGSKWARRRRRRPPVG